MSKRNEIIDGSYAANSRNGLIYTEVLGWIDLGHAQGTDIRMLLNRINHGEASTQDRYDVVYAQTMSDPWRILRVGKSIKWRIRRGRPYRERQSIALAMMMTIARRFEAFQGAFPNNLLTDSGFSGEDLVSDLLGFYRIVTTTNPFPMLQPVSKEQALRRWDHYGPIGSFKNETFLCSFLTRNAFDMHRPTGVNYRNLCKQSAPTLISNRVTLRLQHGMVLLFKAERVI